MHCKNRWAPTQFNIAFIRCGHCQACIVNRQLEWRSRLQLEWMSQKAAPWFLTLTYDNHHLPHSQQEATTLCQKYWKRIRRNGFKLRYFLVTEEGTLHKRIHHHAVFWIDEMHHKVMDSALRDTWGLGFISVSRVRSTGALSYCSKYLQKGGHLQYSNKPPLGSASVADWHKRIAAQHRKSPFRSRRLVPDLYTQPIAGQLVQVKIPEAQVRSSCKVLGVPYAPDDKSLLSVAYRGVPRGPIEPSSKKYIKARLDA